MTFKEALVLDAIEICSTDYWGEEITYYPAGELEEGLVRAAVIEREPVDASAMDPAQGVVIYEMLIPNDTTAGVAAASVSVGLDLVAVADEAGTIRHCTVIQCRDEYGMLRMTLRVGPEAEEEP